MSSDALPTTVRQFLAQYVKSVEQLEILLLLAAAPDKEWTVSGVYGVVRSSESSVAARLEDFRAQGLLMCHSGPPAAYRYAPASESLRTGVSETAKLYQERRVRVIEAIFSPSLDPLQGFSDAFKFRNT